MASIELYIDNQLCETENPENFSIYLKRQFLNPAELSTKDAQKSYDITLPATATNNIIFGYTNVEEVKGKFARLYDAQLLVNGIRIFDGKFKLSEITRTSYKGNLGVPAPKTVKDIFGGEMKLSDSAPMEIEFDDFVESVNNINTKAKEEIQKCIFPYVLYGLLPKNSKDSSGYIYSPRLEWDDTVILGNQHLPPSINVMMMLKHIFETKEYTLHGTALDDTRLNSLYMSYKNAPDYIMPWNYGSQGGYVKISGEWENGKGENLVLEKNGIFTRYPGWDFYTGDLFNSTNAMINDSQIIDPGGNFSIDPVSQNGRTWNKCKLTIPKSGYYKIRFKANLEIDHSHNNWFWQDPDTGFHFAGGISNNYNNYLRQRRYEIKLLRDHGNGDFGLYESR